VEGSQARLPAPSPRGTERDSFPSLGSSSTKASVNQSLTRELGFQPERPSRYTPAAVAHVFRQCWGRTRPVVRRPFAFPPQERFYTLSRDVPPTGRRPAFASGNIKTRIRAITARHSLLPASYARTAIGKLCSLLSPKGAIRGFHVPLAEVRRVRCLLWTGRRMGHESAFGRRCSHLHCRFGPSVIATSACFE